GPVAEGVRRLLEQQDRLLVPELASTVAPGGGGGAPTVVVAAADATDLSKAKADFVCSGTADQVIINQAVAIAEGTNYGGRVLLTEGSFYLSDQINIGSDVWLQGMGDATFVGATFATNGTAVYAAGFHNAVSDMIIEVASEG